MCSSDLWSVVEYEPSQPAPGPENYPLGIEDMTGYEQFEVRLKVGDLVLAYTDSLIESRDGTGRLLGPHGLLKIVEELDLIDPATVIPSLLGRIERLGPGNLAGDDLTILLFRPNGLAPRPAMRSYVNGTLRAVRAIFAAIASGERLPLPDGRLASIGGALLWPLGRAWRGGKALVSGRPPVRIE